MRRVFLSVAVVLLLAVIAGGGTYFAYQNYPWLFSTKYTIRIATGPLTESGDKFVASFLREMANERPRVQVTFIQTPDLDASAEALKTGRADAALVRSDNPMAAEGRTLALMRKVAVMTILGGQSSAEDWADLKGKTIGVLSSSDKIDPLQQVVLDFYGVAKEKIRLVAPKDIGAQIAGGHIAALVATGPAGPGSIADAVRAIRLATKKAPKVLGFDEADAIAERYSAYEKLDVAQGALVGSPPLPEEEAAALAVTIRLVSKRSLSNYAAGEITRIILATKAKLGASAIGTGQVEAPDTDKPLFPIHPGTIAYLAGDKPALLDDSLTYLYAGSLLLGAFGSFGAWWGAFLTRRLQREIRERVAALPTYLEAIKTGSPNDIDRIENELDELSEWLVEHYLREQIPSERYSTIEAKLAEIRAILGRRRSVAEKDRDLRAEAA